MDLDNTGWPQLPRVGSKIEFRGGDITLQVVGACTILRADHIPNAARRPGGRVTLKTERGEVFTVTLSQLRDHAVLLQDGLAQLELEHAARWAADHG